MTSSAAVTIGGYSDSEGNGFTVLYVAPLEQQVNDVSVIIPEGVNYIRACSRNTTSAVSLVYFDSYNVTERINNVSQSVEDNYNKIINLISKIVACPFPNYYRIEVADGSITENNNYVSTDIIPVKPGDKVLYTGMLTSNMGVPLAGYSDEECTQGYQKFVEITLDKLNKQLTVEVTIPARVNYIRACSRNIAESVGLTLYSTHIWENVIDLYNPVFNQLTVLIEVEMPLSIRLNTNGTITETTSYQCTNFIPVSKDDICQYTGRVTNSSYVCVAGYSDSEANGFTVLLQGTGEQINDALITIPEGVNYVRACSRTFDVGNISFKTNTYIKEEVVKNTKAITGLAKDVTRSLKPLKDNLSIAVMGDSIATSGDLNPYFVVLTQDVGNEIQSYVTWMDVYHGSDTTSPTGKTIGRTTITNDMVGTTITLTPCAEDIGTVIGDTTITNDLVDVPTAFVPNNGDVGKKVGGITLTKNMIGSLITFKPVLEDVGKKIGEASIYNNSTTFPWPCKLCELLDATLINASWSGSSTCAGQGGENPGGYRTLSYAWSDYTIERCRKRKEDGTYINPDVIILGRGVNDFSHGQENGYSYLDSEYDIGVLGYPETDRYFEFIMESNSYDYPEVGTIITDSDNNISYKVLWCHKENSKIYLRCLSDADIPSTGNLQISGESRAYINRIAERGFYQAYYLTIKKLRDRYKNAIIYCTTIGVFKRIDWYQFPTKNGQYTLPQMNDAIRNIANTMGCGLIEFDKDGITFENCYSEGYITDASDVFTEWVPGNTYTVNDKVGHNSKVYVCTVANSDSTWVSSHWGTAVGPTHPNAKGHLVMAKKALADLNHTLD